MVSGQCKERITGHDPSRINGETGDNDCGALAEDGAELSLHGYLPA
jgi:hypothetical protein